MLIGWEYHGYDVWWWYKWSHDRIYDQRLLFSHLFLKNVGEIIPKNMIPYWIEWKWITSIIWLSCIRMIYRIGGLSRTAMNSLVSVPEEKRIDSNDQSDSLVWIEIVKQLTEYGYLRRLGHLVVTLYFEKDKYCLSTSQGYPIWDQSMRF